MIFLWIAVLVCVLAGIWLYAGRSVGKEKALRPAGGKKPDAQNDWALGGTPLVAGAAQHIGEREEQQDTYGFRVLEPLQSPGSTQRSALLEAAEARSGMLAVLADGMGGYAMGQEAGQLAVETMLSTYEQPSSIEAVPGALETAVHQAAEAVWELARNHELEWNVGTTLICALIQGSELFYLSVGDSRIYLLREGELHLLTRDHIYANRLFERVQAGELTMDEALSHPERELLTSYLGLPELVEIETNQEPLRLQPGDWVLLCSDGMYGELSEPLLEEAVRLDPQQAAEFLVQHVIKQGRAHQDNASMAIIAFG